MRVENKATGWGPDHQFALPDGRTGWWVGSGNHDSRCDNGHPVTAKQPRGWINDPTGRTTKKSHGHARRYYCTKCMEKIGAPEQPRSWW